MEFTKASLKTLRDEIDAALQSVAEKHGLTVQVGGGSYDPHSGMFKPKVEFSYADRAEREWKQWARLYGLDEADLGRSFRSGAMTFTIIGVNPKARSKPIICRGGDGRREYVWAVDAVKRLLGAAA